MWAQINPMNSLNCLISVGESLSSPRKDSFSSLELTEFPKIDASDDDDDDEDEGRKKTENDDDMLSNSMSSVSIDGCSLNQTNNPSGMTSIQPTSDYESFADCLRQSSPTAAAHANVKSLTNITLNTHFSAHTSGRVNGEDSSSLDASQQRRERKNGISSTTGKPSTTHGLLNNETPLLSHLFGTHKHNSDSN